MTGPAQEPVTALTTSDSLLEQRVGVPLRRATNITSMQEWYGASFVADRQGALTVFLWTVPDGLVQDERSFQLDIGATVLDSEATIDQWGVVLVKLHDDHAEVIGEDHFAAESARVMGETADRPLRPAYLGPTSISASSESIRAGDRLAIVLAARTSEPAAFAVVFRPDPEPRNYTSIGRDLDEFVLNLTVGGGRTLHPIGTGSVFRVAEFASSNIAIVQSFSRQWTPDVVIEEAAPVPLQVMRLSADVQVPRGLTFASGGMFGVAYQARWALDASLHGREFQNGSAVTHVIVVPQTIELFGTAAYILMTSGEGPAVSSLDVQGVGSPPADIVIFNHITYGVDLEEILGVPVRDELHIFEGTLSEIPPALSLERWVR